MKNALITLTALLWLSSCSIEPQSIAYGKDACGYCKMNIVDQQHAAEIVTKKGKVYKYDAIECMLQDEDNNSPEKTALFLVMDYNSPNTFVGAEEATYLISENVPSPMGANLSAFASKSEAERLQIEKSGTLYTWDEISKKF